MDNFEKKLDELGSKIDAKLAESNEIAKNSAKEVGEKIANEKKAELDAMIKEYTELETKNREEMNNRLDEFETNQKKLSGYKEARKSVIHKFRDEIKESEQFKNFKSKNAKSAIFEVKGNIDGLFTKADLTESSNFSGDVVEPDFIDGINFDPDEPNRIRAFMPVSGTASNDIRYLQETARTDNAAITAEAAALGQSEFTITRQTAAVEKIGHYVTVTEEMLEDLPALMGFISNRLGRQVKVVEDTQLLYGTGASNQLTGISIGATAYVDALADSNIQEWDVLAASMKQLREANYVPNVIFVDPSKYDALIRAKDADGRYLNDWMFSGRPLNLMGVPIIQNNSVTDGDFFVADLSIACQIFDKRSLQIEMTNSNSTDFVEDKVSIKLTERLALANYRPGGVIYGSFAEALAQGSA